LSSSVTHLIALWPSGHILECNPNARCHRLASEAYNRVSLFGCDPFSLMLPSVLCEMCLDLWHFWFFFFLNLLKLFLCWNMEFGAAWSLFLNHGHSYLASEQSILSLFELNAVWTLKTQAFFSFAFQMLKTKAHSTTTGFMWCWVWEHRTSRFP
jgi:hypothetical protein